MSRIIYIQQLPKNDDEAYLIKIGKLIPKMIMLHDDPKDEKHQFKCIIDSHAEINDKLKIWDEFKYSNWVEFDVFTGKRLGTYFSCSSMQIVNSNEVYFDLLEEHHEPDLFKTSLYEDESAVKRILLETNTSDPEKADQLLTLLLDRQMYLNDPDELVQDQAYYEYDNAQYADFFDKVLRIINELDPEYYETNKSQITLPSLEDFL